MSQNFANILFFIGFALAVLSVLGDTVSSISFINYGLTEKNKLTRDKYGYFDTKKNLILSGIFLGVVGAAGFCAVFIKEPFVTAFAAGMSFVIVLIRGYFGYWKNEISKKETRQKQINTLRELKTLVGQSAGEEQIQGFFQRLNLTMKAGRTFYPLFGFVYSDDMVQAVAIDEVQKRLMELSVKDESQWFPK
jgi:hypothetical protein